MKILCLPTTEEHPEAYDTATRIERQTNGFFLRHAIARIGKLSQKFINRTDAYQMIQRRVKDADLRGRLSCQSFPATGITTYLENGGNLEMTQWIAGHADSRTTKLYDRRNHPATLDDIERIRF